MCGNMPKISEEKAPEEPKEVKEKKDKKKKNKKKEETQSEAGGQDNEHENESDQTGQ